VSTRRQVPVVDDLRSLPLFTAFSEEQLDWLSANGASRVIEPGWVYQKGQPAESLFVLLEGEVEMRRGTDAELIDVVRTSQRGTYGGAVLAYLGVSPLGSYTDSMLAVTSGSFFILPAEAFANLLERWFPMAVLLLRGQFDAVLERRDVRSQREQMHSFQSLAADLTHELNNPAAAAVRATSLLRNRVWRSQEKLTALAQGKYTGEQLAALVDSLGGQLSGFSGYNAWGVQSQWLSSDWRKGLTLIQQSLLQPAFPATELARLKAQVGARIQEQQDDPMTAASLLLRQTFYGDHPYGRSSLGTAASVASITRSDLVAYWNQVMLPRSTVLSIYGDVNPAEVRRLAGQMFSGFTRGGKLPGAPAAAVPPSQFIVKEQSKPGVAQAVLFFGYPSIKATDPDRYAIDVLDAALSGSNLPGGRLHARLRDNQLVYVVHAFDQPGLDPGMFVVYAATTKANRAKVQSIIQEELQKVREADISPQELAIAKSMAISAHAIESQTDLSQAQQAAGDELLGLGYNESTRYEAGINAVTIADVRRAAQQYLRPNAAALAVVEPVGESR